MSSPTDLAARARGLLRIAPARVDHLPALRIAVGLAIPLAILLAAGRVDWAMYAGFGAFTGIYSRYEPTRVRFRRQGLAGAQLTLCVTLGAGLAQLTEVLPVAAGSWLVIVVTALVAGGSAAFVTSRGLKPGGAIFPVFAVSAVASAAVAAPFWLAGLVAAACAALCIVLGLLGHWAGERHPDAVVGRDHELFTARQLGGEFVRYTVAALVAGALGLLSGLPFPYWAQVAAVAPLSSPGHGARVERAVHRLVGTVLGVVVTAFLLSFPAEPWQLVVWVVVLQFLAEMFILRNYSLALLFVTPLALLMVQLGHPQPAVPMLQARVLETAIGVVVGLVLVLGRYAREQRAV
ncbi:FUSC family protein [Brachybacterium sp. J153]|uniref:FUSC family protein n=1 Tax=Brachybacterium sp. J153 TaxID=3116488 RepID=UPI002E75B92B|nr:FUSC family protein [Brachybacterium sp. J153]MEE1618429.1 FUSC family protein [Brachybacterium sp. J153]